LSLSHELDWIRPVRVEAVVKLLRWFPCLMPQKPCWMQAPVQAAGWHGWFRGAPATKTTPDPKWLLRSPAGRPRRENAFVSRLNESARFMNVTGAAIYEPGHDAQGNKQIGHASTAQKSEGSFLFILIVIFSLFVAK